MMCDRRDTFLKRRRNVYCLNRTGLKPRVTHTHTHTNNTNNPASGMPNTSAWLSHTNKSLKSVNNLQQHVPETIKPQLPL